METKQRYETKKKTNSNQITSRDKALHTKVLVRFGQFKKKKKKKKTTTTHSIIRYFFFYELLSSLTNGKRWIFLDHNNIKLER